MSSFTTSPLADLPGVKSAGGIQVDGRKSRLSVKRDFNRANLHRKATAKPGN